MNVYLGVKFRAQGQIYFFSAQNSEVEVKVQDWVLVSTEEGPGLAHVVLVQHEPPENLAVEDIKPVQRVATGEDFQVQAQNEELGREAFAFCQDKIQELGLDMKLVDVEVRFDQSKIVFYFTAPARIDFRELVKILVTKHRTRIELRQIGVRHEAQILGGIGNCGRVCCCHQFLRKFEPVTIKMAKEQQLFLNPSKISGACGRLLCCLNFEREIYADFQRRCPKIGKKYSTAWGEVKVLRANMFRDSLVVDTGEGGEKEISLEEWAELVQGKPEAKTASGPDKAVPGKGGSESARSGRKEAASGSSSPAASQEPQEESEGQGESKERANPGPKQAKKGGRSRRSRSKSGANRPPRNKNKKKS